MNRQQASKLILKEAYTSLGKCHWALSLCTKKKDCESCPRVKARIEMLLVIINDLRMDRFNNRDDAPYSRRIENAAAKLEEDIYEAREMLGPNLDPHFSF
jgi:hypothetical protein